MPKIKCVCIACKHNDPITHYCICEEEIVLKYSDICGECGYDNDDLMCSNFTWKTPQ